MLAALLVAIPVPTLAASPELCFRHVKPDPRKGVLAGNYPLCKKYETYLNEFCEGDQFLGRRLPGKKQSGFKWPKYEEVDARAHRPIIEGFVFGNRPDYGHQRTPYANRLSERYWEDVQGGKVRLFRTLLDVDYDGKKEFVYVADGLPSCYESSFGCRFGPNSLIVDPATQEPHPVFYTFRSGHSNADVILHEGRVYFSYLNSHWPAAYRIVLFEMFHVSGPGYGPEGKAGDRQVCVFDSAK